MDIAMHRGDTMDLLPPITLGCERLEVVVTYDQLNRATVYAIADRPIGPNSARLAETPKPAPEAPRRRRVILRP